MKELCFLPMGTRYLTISAASTALSFVALLVWTDFSLDKLKIIFSEDFVHLESIDRAIELVLGSYATYTLLGNFVLNAFVLLILCLTASLVFCDVIIWY